MAAPDNHPSLAKRDSDGEIEWVTPLRRVGDQAYVGPWMMRNVRAIIEAVFSDVEGPPPSDRLDWLCNDFEDFLARVPSARLTYRVGVIAICIVGPLVARRLSSFRSLPVEDRVTALQKLESSPLGFAVLGMKVLGSIVYYEHPDAAREIGFDASCHEDP